MAIKSGSHSEKKSYSSSKDKNKQPPTKVVIRRLPPDMAADTFREQVAPLPDHDYLCFVSADPGLTPHAFSRAYINFLHMDDIVTFRDRFDGYVFVDKQGFEYPAVVEFAPYQRTPRRRGRKPDAKSGTIFDDPDYRAFLAACEQPEPEPAPPSWEQTLEEIEKRHSELRDANAVTPLVTYVCKRRAERKEERRRRELEKRKEETRKAREKLLAKEKRETREKSRYESKESSKAIRDEEKDRQRDDASAMKRYDDKPKEKYGKEYTKEKYGKESSRSDKDDKCKRKEKEERWKDDVKDKPKREERTRTYSREERRKDSDWGREERRKDSDWSREERRKDSDWSREERRKDSDWEDRKKRVDKRMRASDSSSELSAAGREGRDRAAEGKDASSSRAADGRGAGDAAEATAAAADGVKTSPGKREASDAKKERKDSKGDRGKTGLKNKDRPSLAIYRPGMGKYSSRRLRDRDSQSSSPPPAAGEEDRQRPAPLPPRTLVFRRSRAAE